MSHKDAPPETPSQIACREFWERAQPTVTRAWGRAKDGSFLAEESRLLHKAWEAASGEVEAWSKSYDRAVDLGQQHRASAERLQVEVAELRRALWLTVQSSGGQLWIERREAEAFDPDRSELTAEWCTDDRYLVRASTAHHSE